MTQLNLYKDIERKWLAEARIKACQYAREHGTVCADDIHRIFPIPNTVNDRRLMGAVFIGMKWIGFKRSERELCHHRVISVFENQNNGKS